MADKYAAKRPKRSRSCKKASGLLKRPLTEEQAREAAKVLTEREGRLVRAYKCPDCEWWHTGRAPR